MSAGTAVLDPKYREWKRNGVAGVYLVVIEEGPTGGRAKIRPLYHMWAPPYEIGQHRARWVAASRLRRLTGHMREQLAIALARTESQP